MEGMVTVSGLVTGFERQMLTGGWRVRTAVFPNRLAGSSTG